MYVKQFEIPIVANDAYSFHFLLRLIAILRQRLLLRRRNNRGCFKRENLTTTTRYLILSCRTNQHVDNSKYRYSLFGGFSFAPSLSSFLCSDISLPRRYLSLDKEWLFPPTDSSRHPFLQQLFPVSTSEIF